ncbi:hypothetical protein C8R43DRAFT_1142905 [Mycena crocata]|nr:hypothetical protein C8R43DRAFT_1142905 [Mycena crocata]
MSVTAGAPTSAQTSVTTSVIKEIAFESSAVNNLKKFVNETVMSDMSNHALLLIYVLFPRPPPPFTGDFPEYIPVSNPGFAQLERERRGKAIYRQSLYRNAIHPIRPTDAALVGPWHGIRIRTMSEGVNFELWLISGCTFAREYYSWILRSYSGDPTVWRSEGEAYILRRQDFILRGLRDRAEWLQEEAQRLPPVPEAPPTPAEAPAMLVDVHSPTTTDTTPAQSSSTIVGLQPSAIADLRAALDDVDNAPPEYRGQNFLGNSPPSPEGTTAELDDVPTSDNSSVRVSSRMTLADAVRFYAVRNTSEWPTGMRDVSGDIPTSASATPHPSDVIAYTTIMALAPNLREAPLQNGEFVRMSLEIFSILGYYYRIAQVGGYVGDNEPLSQYPFDADHMTHAHVAAWYITHGIGIDHSIELLALGAFARAARNRSENRDDLTSMTFTSGFPQRNEDILRLSADNIPAWNAMNFGEIREAVRLANPGLEVVPPGSSFDDEQDPLDTGEDTTMEDGTSDTTLLDDIRTMVVPASARNPLLVGIRPLVLDEADRDPNDHEVDYE